MHKLWRGNANAWECDELGHLNVRFYLAKAMQAVERLSEMLGMQRAFGAETSATLIAREVHIRFFAEARPGAPLKIEGAIVEVGETSFTVALLMHHAAREEIAASFLITLDHATPREGRVFVWPERTMAALEAFKSEMPEAAAPRGIARTRPDPDISLARADAMGLALAGQGRFVSEDADTFGRMKAECGIGKISDSVVHFADGFPEQWADFASGRPLAHASALLELRIAYRRYARPGDGFVIRSGLTRAGEKVRSLVHWVLDPVTGTPWWSAEGVGCIMDLKTRKLVRTTPERLETLQKAVRADLMARVTGVEDAHHLHIWCLTPERPMATLHVRVKPDADPGETLNAVKARLKAEFGLDHVTVEVETGPCADAAEC